MANGPRHVHAFVGGVCRCGDRDSPLCDADVRAALLSSHCGECGHLLQEHTSAGGDHCNVLACACRRWRSKSDARMALELGARHAHELGGGDGLYDPAEGNGWDPAEELGAQYARQRSADDVVRAWRRVLVVLAPFDTEQRLTLLRAVAESLGIAL